MLPAPSQPCATSATICVLCRHPASGYVQGINDLVTPFLAVFLSQHFDGPMEEWRMEQLPEECLLGVEADAYWCLSKLVDSIQDHYINGQPGIQRTVFHLKELVRWAGRCGALQQLSTMCIPSAELSKATLSYVLGHRFMPQPTHAVR